MLSYQHIYHAGNFADVHKHSILIAALKTLRIKPARLAMMDTHAGRGLYNLISQEAQKTSEFTHGAARIWQDSPPGLADYAAALRRHNSGDLLQFYPGSAQIMRDMLRPQDRLICVERHPGEFQMLAQNFASDAHQVTTLSQDGFDALDQSTPPPERRGLAIIDPSYEIKREYEDLPRHLLRAWKKWPQGCYLVWYPLMDNGAEAVLLEGLRKTVIKDILISEIRMHHLQQEHYRMKGSGLALINPPWPESFLSGLTKDIAAALDADPLIYWLDNKHIDPDTGRLTG